MVQTLVTEHFQQTTGKRDSSFPTDVKDRFLTLARLFEKLASSIPPLIVPSLSRPQDAPVQLLFLNCFPPPTAVSIPLPDAPARPCVCVCVCVCVCR